MKPISRMLKLVYTTPNVINKANPGLNQDGNNGWTDPPPSPLSRSPSDMQLKAEIIPSSASSSQTSPIPLNRSSEFAQKMQSQMEFLKKSQDDLASLQQQLESLSTFDSDNNSDKDDKKSTTA